MFKFKKSIIKTDRISNYSFRSQNKLNLDRNEKVLPLTIKGKRKLNKYFEKLDINLYPNLSAAYKRLSKYVRFKKENILITEGVSGAIKNILDSTYIDKKVEIIVPKPSFALYKIFSKIYSFSVKTYSYNKNFNLDINKITKLISKKTSIVFITFPNIPVEGEIKFSEIKELANILYKNKILLVIDEVYYPFNKSSAISLVKKFTNIVIMRSFSKAYGLAGARIGYMVSSKSNIKNFSKSKGGYETNMLSVQAMNFALDNIKLTTDYVKETRLGFKILKEFLKKYKINFFGGNNSNFIFINLKSTSQAKKIYEKLKAKKIMIRFGFEKPLHKGLVITGCPPKQMKKFINEFKKIYSWKI